jgi:hypothetical protein
MHAEEVRRRYADQLTWPDSQLLAWATSVVGIPKVEPADSFVLHAPLELMARTILLPLVEPGCRQRARERLVGMVDEYDSAGQSVSDPRPTTHDSVDEGMGALVRSIEGSDLDAVDRHALWLGTHATVGDIRRGLGSPLAPSLAAAAHGSIALHLMGRCPAIGPHLVRGVAREIGRHPDWLIPWDGLATGDLSLIDALLDAPQLGMPGSDFILPMVVHGSAAAGALLADVSDDEADGVRALSRVAAWSMLQDAPERAPYGWTHTLTIPQAVMSLGLGSRQAVALAASQVIGFRCSMGTRTLDTSASVSTTPPPDRVQLATMASLHFDAHLVKYTLASLDAADSDPEMADLYFRAATHLHGWWATQSDDDFFGPLAG